MMMRLLKMIEMKRLPAIRCRAAFLFGAGEYGFEGCAWGFVNDGDGVYEKAGCAGGGGACGFVFCVCSWCGVLFS